MDPAWARERLATARVARLATVSPTGRPHLVPIVFAVEGDIVYTAVDEKPKSTFRLRRLDNIAQNPQVCVLADQYAADWDELWWARADGHAQILAADSDEAGAGLTALAQRYPSYRQRRPPGPVIAIEVARWSGWKSEPDQ